MRYLIVFFTFLLSVTFYGQNDYSMSFDGVDDYVNIPANNSLDINDAITISSWVKSDGDHLSEIAGRMEDFATQGYRIALRNTGEIWGGFGNYNSGDVAVAANAYTINEWVYVTGVFKNNSYVKIYINGILRDSVPTTRSFSAFNSNLSIGRVSLNYNPSPYVFYEHMHGNLSQLAQWDQELSQAEIQQYMNCPPTGNEEGLIGYWNFEEGSGTTVFDQTENGNNGEVNGATWSTDVPEQNCPSDCTDSVACNYNPDATDDDGTCDYSCCPGPGCCLDGQNWDWDLMGCVITNPTDTNLDGCTDLNDLMDILAAYGTCTSTLPEFATCGDDIEHEGYSYSTVQIGEQCWFSENCRYLPEVSPSSEGIETDPYYYVYEYQGTDVAAAKLTSKYETYGVLYNWPAVMTEGICPSDWHIPSDGEFMEFADFLGGEVFFLEGGKMKEAGYDHWNPPNTGATNSSGFTGLPGGYSSPDGFGGIGTQGGWWSATDFGPLAGPLAGSFAGLYDLHYNNLEFHPLTIYHFYGFSARCVRD